MARQRKLGSATTAAAVRKRLRQVADKVGGQEKLADLSGLDRNTVSRWFGQKPDPAMPRIELLAQVAGATLVSLDWLVLGRGRMEWQHVGRAQLLGELQQELVNRAKSRHNSAPDRSWRALALLSEVDPDEMWDNLMQYGAYFLEDVAADHHEEDAAGDEDWSSHPPPK